MIAIAGAKGGCGKTTATLGVATAVADSGAPVVVADADRQLPNLHTVAGVDREPTIATVDGPGDVTEAAQAHPASPNLGVLPAPLSDEVVDVQSTLERIATASVRTLVDCPSGAGPDVVEPLSVADAVLVVTDGTERSQEAAMTTVRMADRLDVDILGLVANRCESVPDELTSRTDVPVLACIPERERPLSNDETAAAFQTLLTEIRRSQRSDPSLTVADSHRMATGIDPLDDHLDGGFPAGSVVALTADADSQSELLLHRLTATRGTLYLTTDRSVSIVRDALDTSSTVVGNATVRAVGGSSPLSDAIKYVEDVPERANVVVDTGDELERLDRSAYTDFLDSLVQAARELQSLVVIHCLQGEDTLANRSKTVHYADFVLDVNTSVEGNAVKHSLSISKSRRELAPSETVAVDLTDELTMGPSRN